MNSITLTITTTVDEDRHTTEMKRSFVQVALSAGGEAAERMQSCGYLAVVG